MSQARLCEVYPDFDLAGLQRHRCRGLKVFQFKSLHPAMKRAPEPVCRAWTTVCVCVCVCARMCVSVCSICVSVVVVSDGV